MRELLRMIGVLSLICALSGLLLATVKQGTRTKIEEQVLTYVQGPAIRGVLSEYDNNPILERKSFDVPGGEERVIVFPAMKKGHLKMVAMETAAPGFGGDIGVMVGFDLEKNVITGIGMTTMKETPGIGSRVAKHGFTRQFEDHPLEGLALTSRDGTIDAVSGATISSTGAVNAVNRAVRIYGALKNEMTATWSHS